MPTVSTVAAARLLQADDQVVRAAAGRDRDRDVVSAPERDQLPRERLVEADVVADRGHGGHVVRQGDGRPAASQRVAGEVLGVRRGAAVAEGDQVAAVLDPLADVLGAARHGAGVDRGPQLDHVLGLAPGRGLDVGEDGPGRSPRAAGTDTGSRSSPRPRWTAEPAAEAPLPSRAPANSASGTFSSATPA